MNFRVAFALASCILISCCQEIGWLQDDDLSLEKGNYYGNAIRTDGYYYRIVEETTYDVSFGQPYFFYRNGVLLDPGGFPISEQNNFDKEIIERKYEDRYKNSKYNWGIFQVSEDTIRFEKWYPSSGGGLPAYIREGIILSDTAFQIVKSYRITGGVIDEESVKNELYYFHHIEYKPDSTNTFIE